MNNNWWSISGKASSSAQIMIYGPIGDSWSEETVSAKNLVQEIAAIRATDLHVRIMSQGGSVADGIAIYNALIRHPAAVHTYIDGLAASVASMIAMAGTTVTMSEVAMLMIHAPWTGQVGNAEEFRRQADLLDSWATAMAKAYARPGGISYEDALAMLTDGQDHWFTADQAMAESLVDRITPAAAIAASMRSFPQTSNSHQPPPPAVAASTTKETPMDPTETKPAAPPPVATPSAILGAGQISLDEIKAEALRDDAQRRQQIEAIAGPWIKGESARTDVRALVKSAQDTGASIEGFRAEFLQLLGRNSQSIGSGLIFTVADETDKFKAGVTSGLMIRAGLTPNDTSNEFRGYSLIEIARMCMTRRNLSTKSLDKMGIVGAAFTHSTSDFSNLLEDVAHRSMLKGWEQSEETFQLWTSRGTLSDFKAMKRVDLNTFPALAKIEENAEYTYATVGDRGETIQLATYGRLFGISRQAIINDDLDAFTRVPNKMGRAAVRTVGNLVYSVLTTNAAMADGVALFHANHGNLLTAAALSTASVDLAAATMARQTDATGNTLNINLAFLITSRTQKGLAQQIATSENEIVAAKTATTANWMRNQFTVVADPRLDATSTSNWYGAADPNVNDTIEVSYLDGNDAPTLEQQGGWTVDGVQFKVRIDAGVKALDHRGLVKNPYAG